ncbi:thiol-disulfide oxidoreductase DCC family protein [Portibacter lacus]|uniref:Thiol-disulfide oxidoreductase n=1 Tax=Portibacter lacus TaxID=1099794 RepID=A0AA37WHB0_9BACT|nr:DCC1-like thiol-disulfide oxidoreductase family protein [Portibacter lacus]GLR18570.1 thiol-disulfide oxidoreductase [Portibacter lacus]
MISSDNNVVFFDSQCVLCGNLLKLLLKIDRNEKLRFASLQSEFSRSMLPSEFVEAANYKSVAFLKDGELYFYSSAVIELFSTIGFPWMIFKIGYILPKKWRDKLYMKVSNNRYSWFGKSEACMLPDEKLAPRFVHELDV